MTRAFYESEYHFASDVAGADTERWERALDLLEPLAGATFLDLGSGIGWAGHLAGRRGARPVVGADFAWRALRLGNETLPGVCRIQADGSRLPLADGSIDALLSYGSVEHFPDVGAGLREVARVLAPTGSAVVVVPNRHVRTEQPTELRQSWPGWRRLFRGAGLVVVSTAADHGPGVLRDRKPARVALRLAARVVGVVPGLQYQFVFLLRRSPRTT